MPRVRLTRRVAFSAAHRYHRRDWDDERNHRVFGDNVRLHGHNYLLEATVAGVIDADTGMAADIGAVDQALAEVAAALGYRDLSDGRVDGLEDAIPTTEVLAYWAWQRVQRSVPSLVQIRLFESPDLYVDVTADGPEGRP